MNASSACCCRQQLALVVAEGLEVGAGSEVGAGCRRPGVVFRQTNRTHLHEFKQLCTGNGEQ